MCIHGSLSHEDGRQWYSKGHQRGVVVSIFVKVSLSQHRKDDAWDSNECLARVKPTFTKYQLQEQQSNQEVHGPKSFVEVHIFVCSIIFFPKSFFFDLNIRLEIYERAEYAQMWYQLLDEEAQVVSAPGKWTLVEDVFE